VQSGTETDTSNNFENLADSTANTGEETYSDANEITEITKNQEEQLSESVGDMIEYFTKSISDMSYIFEDIKNVGQNSSDEIRNNLVDNILKYVDDTKVMRQQVRRVMQQRAQLQDSMLKQLYSLPISTEDAAKLENALREQIKLRAGEIPNVMNFPQVSKFVPSFNQN